eukprot:COSAG06_NODE_44560_length_362_cov_0.969582_1_plen_72_part_10
MSQVSTSQLAAATTPQEQHQSGLALPIDYSVRHSTYRPWVREHLARAVQRGSPVLRPASKANQCLPCCQGIV